MPDAEPRLTVLEERMKDIHMPEIERRLTVIETQMQERWDSHDKRSESNWTYIKEKLDNLPCECRMVVTANLEKEVMLNTTFRKWLTTAIVSAWAFILTQAVITIKYIFLKKFES